MQRQSGNNATYLHNYAWLKNKSRFMLEATSHLRDNIASVFANVKFFAEGLWAY